MGMFFMTLTMFMGMVGFALVGGNEALLNKEISAQDQVYKILRTFRGVEC